MKIERKYIFEIDEENFKEWIKEENDRDIDGIEYIADYIDGYDEEEMYRVYKLCNWLKDIKIEEKIL